MDIIQAYQITVAAIGGLAILMFCQLIIADLVGIRSKHTPGGTIPTDHNNLHFRVSRTMANTNESVGLFILAVIFCILSGSSPMATAYAAWGFVLARILFAMFYYINLKLWRSVSFGLSLLALLALIIIGLFT